MTETRLRFLQWDQRPMGYIASRLCCCFGDVGGCLFGHRVSRRPSPGHRGNILVPDVLGVGPSPCRNEDCHHGPIVLAHRVHDGDCCCCCCCCCCWNETHADHCCSEEEEEAVAVVEASMTFCVFRSIKAEADVEDVCFEGN